MTPTPPTRKQYNPPVALRPDDTDAAIIAAIMATLPSGARHSDAIRAALQSWADMQQAAALTNLSDDTPQDMIAIHEYAAGTDSGYQVD